MKIKFIPENENVKLPYKKHYWDAANDFEMDRDIIIKPGENIIPLNFRAIVPHGMAGFITLRSSWMSKGLMCLFVPVDADYSGIWHFMCYNVTNKDIVVKKGERLVQLMFLDIVDSEFVLEEDHDAHMRGDNGLGSTGK